MCGGWVPLAKEEPFDPDFAWLVRNGTLSFVRLEIGVGPDAIL